MGTKLDAAIVAQGIRVWLEALSSRERPATDIVAFNIGLFQSTTGYMASLTGARAFDPEDDDWACEEDYVPGERYCLLPGTDAPKVAWKAVQKAVEKAVVEYLRSPVGRESFLARARAVTVGFEDGDLALVHEWSASRSSVPDESGKRPPGAG